MRAEVVRGQFRALRLSILIIWGIECRNADAVTIITKVSFGGEKARRLTVTARELEY
jgi:hypothetical protein